RKAREAIVAVGVTPAFLHDACSGFQNFDVCTANSAAAGIRDGTFERGAVGLRDRNHRKKNVRERDKKHECQCFYEIAHGTHPYGSRSWEERAMDLNSLR